LPASKAEECLAAALEAEPLPGWDLTREYPFDKARRWFEDHVDRSGGPGACHPWTAGRTGSGYGAMRLGSRQEGSHRAAWILERGPLLPGQVVCHRCDNKPCCNIRHLFVGTTQDNVADKVRKARQARGDRNGRAVLTEEQVRYILAHASERNMAALGRQFGVSRVLIGLIVRGRIWRHVARGGSAGPGVRSCPATRVGSDEGVPLSSEAALAV
jgi:hypothetical protein